MFKTLHEAKAAARLEAMQPKEKVVEEPKPEQSQNAADHVEGAIGAIDGMVGEVKIAAAQLVSSFRSEVEQLKSHFQDADQRLVGRLRSANSLMRNFIGGNGGPPLEDVKVIEHKPSE